MRLIDAAIDAFVQAKLSVERQRELVAEAKAACEAVEAEYLAAILHRPWYWRLLGRDHVTPETRRAASRKWFLGTTAAMRQRRLKK